MDLLNELSAFLGELKEYREFLTNPSLGKSKEEAIESLRQKLVRKTGRYKDKIIKLTGKQFYTQFGQTLEMWSNGLQKGGYKPSVLTSLNFCINATNEAIGKLENDFNMGIRDEQGILVTPQIKMTIEAPTAFIAHEGETEQLKKLKDFLDALGIKYFIAEAEASDGRSIEGQVDWTQAKADFAICLATKGKAINKRTGKHYMGLNVADELGRARQVFRNHIILLIQKGVEVHTNTREIVCASFTTQSMDIAFTKLIKELRNWGFIKVEKIDD